MGHPVHINDDDIRATFERVESMPPPAAPASAVVVAPTMNPDAWLPFTKIAASIINHKVCPNWAAPQSVQDDWALALAECAEQMMPGGPGNMANWGPWGKLLAASVAWGLCGFDMDAFMERGEINFKPMLPPPPPGKNDPQPTAPATTGGKFTTVTDDAS